MLWRVYPHTHTCVKFEIGFHYVDKTGLGLRSACLVLLSARTTSTLTPVPGRNMAFKKMYCVHVFREQLGGIGSLLLLCGSQGGTRVTSLGGKYPYPLNHPASSLHSVLFC